MYAQAHGITIICIPGNHDFQDKDCTNHSLISLDSFHNVVTNEGAGYHYVPRKSCMIVNSVAYTEDKNYFINEVNHLKFYSKIEEPGPNDYVFKILLAHTGIQGAKVGTDYVMIKEHDIDIDEVNLKQYDACFFGHYHEHQKVSKNSWIIGATHEQNWSDANGKRGFCHVIITKNDDRDVNTQVSHIATDRNIPRFKVLSDNTDFAQLDLKHWDFIRYKTKQELTQDVIDNITGLVTIKCDGITPKYFEIVPVQEEHETEDFILSEKATNSDSVLDEWVSHQVPKDLDSQKVLQIGKELLTEARNSLL
jgi:DNA repair exonuclease SbcCD nuclease subunit